MDLKIPNSPSPMRERWDEGSINSKNHLLTGRWFFQFFPLVVNKCLTGNLSRQKMDPLLFS